MHKLRRNKPLQSTADDIWYGLNRSLEHCYYNRFLTPTRALCFGLSCWNLAKAMDSNPLYPVLPDWPIEKDIYTGFWVNRSLSKFRAATITLDQRMWNLFIAFIALFVGATARSVWKLVRFAVHHKLSTPTDEDAIHHQRQAVLRNTSLATDAVIQAVQMSHVWRHRAKGRFGGRARALVLLGIASAISSLTTAAGEFSFSRSSA